MIVENLIANFELQEEEEDFGIQNQNLLQVQENVRKFSKMNSHEPTTNWSQLLRDSQLTNNNNANQNMMHHQYKKTLTSTSLESNVFVKGNLVFTNAGGGSHQTTPRKYVEEEQEQQKISFISPIFSREATVKKKSKELTHLHENEQEGQEDSTNEKIQDDKSSGNISPNSNHAVVCNKDSALAKNVQQFEYEKAESNQAELQSSDASHNESQLNQNKSHVKSKFSRNKVSESIFKKQTSFSDHEDSEQDNEKISPKSLQDIKTTTQKVIIQSHQKISSNTEAVQKYNSNSHKQIPAPPTNGQYKNQFMTPAQRRRSELQPVETNKFQNLIQKKKQELGSNEPSTPFSPKEKFKIAGTVARTLSRLQVNQVSRIESTEQLDREIDMMKQLKQNSSFFNEKSQSIKFQEQDKHKYEDKNNDVSNAFNMVRMIEMITDLAERGHPEDVNHIINILQKDPKKYLRSSDDPQHILNKLNSKNQNAAYVACKNGNLNIIQFLIKQEINLNLKSKVGGDIDEYPLQVAVRWNHKEVVDFLLHQRVVKISQDQINFAYKEAKSNKELKKLIIPYMKKKPFFLCC